MSNNPNKLLASMLDGSQLSQLTNAITGFNQQQLIWASGYLAGLAHSNIEQPTQEGKQESSPVTVLFGSQTGNAKHAAQDYANVLKEKSIDVNVINMADYKPRKIKDESILVVFVSTHGEGDAPDDAAELHEFLASKKAPKLASLKYAVVALGDSSYEFFCQTGKDFDARLSNLGASSLLDRLDCDVDYEAAIAAWTEKLTEQIVKIAEQTAPNAAMSVQAKTEQSASQYTKQSPFSATLSEAIKITGRDSIKDIRHIEISLEDSGIVYQPGDALGVWFSNDIKIVERVLSATANKPDDEVSIGEQKMSLISALTDKLELTLSYPGFVKTYQQASKDEALGKILDDRQALRKLLEDSQILDIIEQYPADISAQQLVEALRPITPRLYSIASSQQEVEDEVHLTVAHVAYTAFGSDHQGGASGFLSTRLGEGEEVKVFIESNDNFRLPVDDNTPIIMVGPGTGIAPFRAFMQERESREASGKNWLFFGNPHFTQDFLYQTEWQSYLKSGLLSKISLAFSRDQEHKIYVQDKLLEHGKEVFEWLESGAHFYICGDANKMAKDVEAGLLTLIQEHGSKSLEDAKKYLIDMRKSKRYQKDVY